MKIIIKETQKLAHLLYPSDEGEDWTYQILESFGAIEDGSFTFDKAKQAYHASQATYDQWLQYMKDCQDTSEDVKALAQELDIEEGDIWVYLATHEREHSHFEQRGDDLKLLEQFKDEFLEGDDPYIHFIHEEMLGEEATQEDAFEMVEYLKSQGYQVEYGPSLGQDAHYIDPKDWEGGLEMVEEAKNPHE